MESDGRGLVSPTTEVSVVGGELVATIRELASRGVGTKAIARNVGLARNTVRRYLRQPVAPGRPDAAGRTPVERRSA